MKKMSWKQKLVTLSAVAIVAALSAYGSVAYFTAEDTARNVITAGKVKIELQEKMLTPDGEKTVPFENQLGVMPGCEVSKIVTVKNTADSRLGCVFPWINPLNLPKALRVRLIFLSSHFI